MRWPTPCVWRSSGSWMRGVKGVRNVRDRYAEILSIASFSYPAQEWRYRFGDAGNDHYEPASAKDLEARFPGVLKSILAATRQEDRVMQRRS